ncbi:MAG: hypothetical protein J6A83_04635 [Clostridia bacterium]|nr:hypothetical protein [Clostridia bacterium]
MSENIQKNKIDITPGYPNACQGNKEDVFEGYCYKCEYYWRCFPELDPKNFENIETPPRSKRHKLRMNRLFRERIGGTFLPFPEVDNLFERIRSKLVIKFKINEFFDRRKKRRKAKQKLNLYHKKTLETS